MRYQKVEVNTWNDEKFVKLSQDAKFMFLYFLTCPHSNSIGAYVVKKGYMADDLVWTSKRVNDALLQLRKIGLVRYDDNLSVLVVNNYLKHNTIENPNQCKNAIKNYHSLPTTEILQDVINCLETVSKHFHIPWETVSKPEAVTEAVTVTDTEAEKETVPFEEIVNHLNLKTGKKYKSNGTKIKELIKSRWNEGFTFEQFQCVIDNQTMKWKNDAKMCEYLRPETLFGTKFESYLNAPPNAAQAGIVSQSTQGILGWAERKLQREEMANEQG